MKGYSLGLSSPVILLVLLVLSSACGVVGTPEEPTATDPFDYGNTTSPQDRPEAQPDGASHGYDLVAVADQNTTAPSPEDSCLAIEEADPEWRICEVGTEHCAGVFTNGSGCKAFCAAAGMECIVSYLGGEGCTKALSSPLDCSENTGFSDQWCTCAFPEGEGNPVINEPEPETEPGPEHEPCSQCWGPGNSNCADACNDAGFEHGQCNVPDSTDPGNCCGCWNDPAPETEAVCGDGVCTLASEHCGNCISDCPCSAGVGCFNNQCSAVCGDGVCAAGAEDCGTCPGDCPCPNGTSCSQNQCETFAISHDAEVISASFPASLACGTETNATITMRNTGTETWTRSAGFKLGAVGDNDPFKIGDTRVWLNEEDVIPPGGEYTFIIPMDAGNNAGVFTTDWQMVHEGVAWFGAIFSTDIQVVCDQPVAPPNLNSVTWLHTDVSSWPVTANLSSVTFGGGQICMEYDKKNVWPIATIGSDDTEIVGNPWIFIHQNGQWYAATWEWLRPGQTCKSMSSVAGDHIKQSPFNAASGWTPTSGQTYYIMISAPARMGPMTVYERSNLVAIVWP